MRLRDRIKPLTARLCSCWCRVLLPAAETDRLQGDAKAIEKAWPESRNTVLPSYTTTQHNHKTPVPDDRNALQGGIWSSIARQHNLGSGGRRIKQWRVDGSLWSAAELQLTLLCVQVLPRAQLWHSTFQVSPNPLSIVLPDMLGLPLLLLLRSCVYRCTVAQFVQHQSRLNSASQHVIGCCR
jgi:hypothetical protein